MSTCGFCGEERELDLLEYWPESRAFQLTTCCEELGEEVQTYGLERAEWRALFASWGITIRQVLLDDNDQQTVLDFGLELGEVAQAEAKRFVAEHHGHASKPPHGWRWGHAIRNGGELVAVAMIGRPVARLLDADRIVEVSRCCVSDARPGLTYNCCSMLYAAAAREAKARGFERIITYTLEGEAARGLRAVGWTIETTTRGGSWHRASRPRTDHAPTCRKLRWGKQLRKGTR